MVWARRPQALKEKKAVLARRVSVQRGMEELGADFLEEQMKRERE